MTLSSTMRLFLALALFGLVSAVVHAEPTSGAAVPVDRVIAAVNDAVILESELNRRIAPLAYDLNRVTDSRERQRRRAKLKAKQLEEMINQLLIVEIAEKSQLEISAQQVAAAFNEIKTQNGFDDSRLAAELRKQGYTVAGYRQDVRRQLLRLAAVNQLVRPKVTISDEEVRARYDEIARRSAGTASLRLRHILLALPDNPSDTDLGAARKEAETLIQRARSGTSFETLAAETSDDAGTKSSGGDLGWIERGSLDTEWEAIVFAMKKGEVRGPVRGPQGLHIFHVAEIRESSQKPFDEMKEEVRSELFKRAMDRETRSWVEELRKRAYIDIKL